MACDGGISSSGGLASRGISLINTPTITTAAMNLTPSFPSIVVGDEETRARDSFKRV